MNPNIDSHQASKYATFPKQFLSYRWFKPILVALLTAVFMAVFQVILAAVAIVWAGDPSVISSIGDSYETMDIFTGPGTLIEFGAIGAILPALALATLIVRDRPFSSYSSSRGGWNWRAFAKCLGVAVVLMIAITVVQIVLSPEGIGQPAIRFSLASLIVCLIFIPVQCLAEEYLFRGFILQTVGSWTKLPVVGLLVSAGVFAAGHPYNTIGIVAVFANGIIWGIVVMKTRGLEASSAMHIVNNYLCFVLAGFGLSEMTSEVDVLSLVFDVLTCAAFAVLVIVADKKFGWFSPNANGDSVAKFNTRILAKRERKQRRKRADLPPERPAGRVVVATVVANAPMKMPQPVDLRNW